MLSTWTGSPPAEVVESHFKKNNWRSQSKFVLKSSFRKVQKPIRWNSGLPYESRGENPPAANLSGSQVAPTAQHSFSCIPPHVEIGRLIFMGFPALEFSDIVPKAKVDESQ